MQIGQLMLYKVIMVSCFKVHKITEYTLWTDCCILNIKRKTATSSYRVSRMDISIYSLLTAHKCSSLDCHCHSIVL